MKNEERKTDMHTCSSLQSSCSQTWLHAKLVWPNTLIINCSVLWHVTLHMCTVLVSCHVHKRWMQIQHRKTINMSEVSDDWTMTLIIVRHHTVITSKVSGYQPKHMESFRSLGRWFTAKTKVQCSFETNPSQSKFVGLYQPLATWKSPSITHTTSR